MARHQREPELIDIDCLMRFWTKTRASLAIAKDEDDLVNAPIFLPRKEIEVVHTGRFEAGKEIIKVTMPYWLAEDRELA